MSKQNEIFKVVKIIDSYKLVINAGKEDGVKVNDKFEIYDSGKEIFDPDTGSSLGNLDLIKAYIKVISVFDKMSVCQSTKVIDVSPIASLTSGLSNFVKYELSPLNVDSLDISGGYEDMDNKIHIGDKVRFS